MGLKSEKIPELLTSRDKKPVLGQTLDISPAGPDLILSMPADSELESSELHLSVAEESLKLEAVADNGKLIDAGDEEKSYGQVSSDQGPGLNAGKEVRWIVADWGSDRALVGLKIKTDSKTDSKVKARVKVFYSGVWLPLTPTDILGLQKGILEQSVPPVVAGKLMVEFVTKSETPGLWDPNRVKVTELAIDISQAPWDMTISIGDGAPFFTHQGALHGLEKPITGFDEAVNSYMSEFNTTDIPLMLRARMQAQFTMEKFETKIVSIVRTLSGVDNEGRLPLSWGKRKTVAKVAIGADAVVREVQFGFTSDLVPERLLISSGSPEFTRAQLCSVNYAAAQGFELDAQAGGSTLCGIDLYLNPVRLPARATLTLYPDDMGRPALEPFPGTFAEVVIADEAKSPRQPPWTAFGLQEPFPLPAGPCWAVVQVQEGEIHWCLDRGRKAPKGLLGIMYRIDGGPWLKRLPPEGVDVLWGLARLRASAEKSTGPKVYLRRSGERVLLTPDAAGQVQVAGEALQHINQMPVNDNSKQRYEDLELVFEAEAAGSVTITDPCIKYTC